VNGIEVLDEEKDEGMKAFAFDLIRKSANQASAKLQFARLAFGAARGRPGPRSTSATPTRWRPAT
jgi:hypothetical protein